MEYKLIIEKAFASCGKNMASLVVKLKEAYKRLM